jgi:hypothetical protein
LIIKWQKAHYDEIVCSGKRKDTEVDSDKSKRQRVECCKKHYGVVSRNINE